MDLNKVIKELKKGNNIEKNLSLYGNALAKSYYNTAGFSLAMNLTEYYDAIKESTLDKASEIQEMLDEAVAVAEEVIVGDDCSSLEQRVQTLDVMRAALVKRAKDLGAYTRFLQNYEYILNRVEYRFKDRLAETDIEAFSREVMAYIHEADDPILTNMRIQSVLGELPVRLTADKFYDIVRQASNCYAGVRSDIAGAYFEELKDSAKSMDLHILPPEYTQLYEICSKLSALDYDIIDKDMFETAMSYVTDCSHFITEMLTLDLYMLAIAGDLYTMLLTKPFVLEYSADMEKSRLVIREFIKALHIGNFLRMDEDIVSVLSQLTDRQSVYQGEHVMLEEVLYEVIDKHDDAIEALMLGGLFNSLCVSEHLASFRMLNTLPKGRCKYKPVSKTWIEAGMDEVISCFKSAFEGKPRLCRRALMAQVIGNLPVIFNSLEDAGPFIVRSLETCSSLAEREACIGLIRRIMQEDDAGVHDEMV